mmetsp:Transcript_25359/g.60325  ORF Transcript_25359/g.60325 Transcript_25359/m.60325 type:complete len:226 (+) Transcript_25359:632-1309(+)
MPKYGGKPQPIFKPGTMRMQSTPNIKAMTFDRVMGSCSASSASSFSGSCSQPGAFLSFVWRCRVSASSAMRRAAWHLKPHKGKTPATKDGKKSQSTVCTAEMRSWIQSMVVVTSPMGLQAPPALAAITARPPHSWRYSWLSGAKRRRIFTATMVEVRLSITELSIKVRMQMMGMSRSFRPSMALRMVMFTKAKPSKWSMDSTTPMAGSRKSKTLPTSSSPWLSSS